MTDKSPKSQIIRTSPHFFFPDPYTPLVQFHIALLLQTALHHSAHLCSAPFSSVRLGWAQVRLCSLQLLLTPAPLLSTVPLKPCLPLCQNHISKPHLAGVGERMGCFTVVDVVLLRSSCVNLQIFK